MARKKTRQELELDLRLTQQSKRLEALVTIGKEIIRCGTIIAVAWLLYLSVRTLAGQTTMADIGIRILGDIKINAVLGWVTGGGGISYGIAQKKLRSRTIQRMASRVSYLEKELDKKRTSSRLTTYGDTNPKDVFGVETR